jgi:predicted amidohydrolase YtcJ
VTADLLVRGRVVTLATNGDDLDVVEAIAIHDGRVVVAGRATDAEAVSGRGTRRLDLAPDEVALPGLTDAHLHLADAALATTELRLEDARSLADGLGLIQAADAALGDREAWLLGGGWDAGRWGRWPTAEDLERVAPGRRVVLWSHDLHAVWASRAALAEAMIDGTTADPPGGVIRRTVGGEPEGVLHEDATGLVTARVPRPAPDRLAGLIVAYARRLLALGVVAAHDLSELEVDGSLGRGFATIERLAGSGRLPIRVHAGIRRPALERALERGLRSGDPLGDVDDPRGARAHVGWLKLFADGTLGSRTAALLAPYDAEPARGEPPGGPTGLLVTAPAELAASVALAMAGGLATTIHAIGDRALRAAIDALEPVAGTTATTHLRPRVEHVQLADPADLRRLGRAGIVASLQPAHLIEDAPKARLAWGARTTDSYPWRGLVDAGVSVAFGSDAPAGSGDPWPALAMAITRRDPSWPASAPAFHPEQRLTIGRALRAACVDGALSAGERDRGRLAVGQRADLVVIPAAGLADPAALRETRPRLVVLDGEVVHEA